MDRGIQATMSRYVTILAPIVGYDQTLPRVR